MSRIVISPACLGRYGLLASDLANQSTQLQPAHPGTAPIPAIISTHQSTNQMPCIQSQGRRHNANLNFSGNAHLPFHISNTNPAMICFFNKSFICWAYQSRKRIIAIVKFYPFSTMDPSLKSQ
ncbi:hypothetical protein VP01_3360g1 [Puccinia sorghi]|uniref:Uncharacterized protein n=1 Tax=Puccinia sorghi TaxID=27349 RepID=A0A0L6UYT7_9BASI|nr:hypothetical protein VP01_3360g1 [Puccinia sorghi]